jgi:redox-sensitive bicupin YhaK (pirin superfamily)
MLTLRRSDDRGHANHGWLDSRHTFSFGDYHDPQYMGFGPLRVINEDRVAPGQGFGTHGHRDMEIISYVLSGQLAHRDSLGNGSVLRYGDVQRMTAGTGVRHSEFNASSTDPVHFLQIWVLPAAVGLAPGYEERRFGPASKRGQLRLIASADGREDSLRIHQDASVYAAILDGEDRVSFTPASGRGVYVQLARGRVTVNGALLDAGDAAQLTSEATVTLEHGADAELLLFDLPP